MNNREKSIEEQTFSPIILKHSAHGIGNVFVFFKELSLLVLIN